jgi:hypothetical protein
MPGLYLQANDLLYDHTTGLIDDTKPVKPGLLVLNPICPIAGATA